MSGADSNYFRRREQEARQLAENASNPAVRAIHLEMADTYARRARQSEHRRPPLGLFKMAS
jgi:hypothetical protein